MTLLVPCLAAMLAATATAPTATAPTATGGEARVAVVIGNNIGIEGDDPLEFAEQDAVRFRDLLIEVGRVEPSRAQLVIGTDADEVRRALAEAIGRIHELARLGPTSLIVYVAAHADEEAIHLEGTLLPLAELERAVQQAPAKLRLRIIDACRTPVRSEARGGHPAPEVAISFRREAAVSGDVSITSAGPGEPAQEWSLLRGALFSHHLMAGLRGLADADGDGRISLAEVYSYAYRRTASQAARSPTGSQHPSFSIRMEGFGDWIFSEPGDLSARMEIGADIRGRVLIANTRGELIAELEKGEGDQPQLALKPGKYRVVVPDGASALAADVDLSFGGRRTIRSAELTRIPLRRAMARGGEAIVPRPWSVGLGYALSSSMVSGAGARHFAVVELSRELGSWFVRAELSGAMGSFAAQDAVRIRDRTLGLALAAGYSVGLGWLSIDLGARAEGLLLHQSVSRPDEALTRRALGFEEPDHYAWAPSASLVFGPRMALSDTLSLRLEGRTGLIRVPLADDTSSWPSSQAETAATVKFATSAGSDLRWLFGARASVAWMF